jgi:hypothetical protein
MSCGLDRIYDFETGTDKIDISAYGIIAFEDLDVSAEGADLVIDLDGTAEHIAEITLLFKTSASSSDFIYV